VIPAFNAPLARVFITGMEWSIRRGFLLCQSTIEENDEEKGEDVENEDRVVIELVL
jgi:hypothetical protein